MKVWMDTDRQAPVAWDEADLSGGIDFVLVG